jgi:ABC transporter substrate binding protein (PQQ-dependent alcohol dehydrogenase system)
VVFVADAGGEFARYVPYRTTHPRPVVGSDGLIPGAWHALWERHGAPQLNRRFQRAAGRAMTDEDWAAWVAVRAIVEAALATNADAVAALATALARPDFAIELYKGAPGSFRPWDRQLRQPILLHTHSAVVDRAPLEGFLHERNTLDTLGLDQLEFRCG